MEWQGEASVMTSRKHGENAVILTVLSREAGLISGLAPPCCNRAIESACAGARGLRINWAPLPPNRHGRAPA